MKLNAFVVVVLSLIFSASFAQKKLIRQASKLEKAELYEEAAEKYMQALYRNNTKVESKKGLERTAQKVLNEKLSAYFKARNSDDLAKALELYEAAEYYSRRIDYFGIKLTFPDFYRSDYQEDKQLLLTSLYTGATNFLQTGQYEQAQQKFAKIKSIDPSYKDVAALSTTADAEPIYLEAVNAFERGNYGLAWERFESVERTYKPYRDTESYKQKIVAQRALTLSVLLAQSSKFQMTEDKIRFHVLVALSKLNNPFVQIVDRDNLQLIIEEQKLGLSGIIDANSAAELGNILGAKTVLLMRIVNYNYIPGQLVRMEKTAYEANQYAVRDDVTGAVNYPTQYRAVRYTEYTHRRSLQVSLQYQLISSETGEVLLADIIREELSDVPAYAQYAGNYHSLHPAQGDRIYKSGKERDQFLQLFAGKREPLTRKQLDFDIQPIISEKVAQSIDRYFNNLE